MLLQVRQRARPGGADVPLPEEHLHGSAAHLRRAARQDARLRRGEARRRHHVRPGNAVRAGQERQQDVATNLVQSLPQDQRQAGRHQQHSTAKHQVSRAYDESQPTACYSGRGECFSLQFILMLNGSL